MAVPDAALLDWRPLPGGLINTNLLLRFDRPPGQAVLRLYQRGAAAAAREAALAALLAGRVPLATVLHAAPRDDPPWAMLAHVPGRTLDAVAPALAAPALQAVAAQVGRVLASVHAIRQPRTGFLGADLSITPIDLTGAGLRAWLDETVRHGAAGRRLGAPLAARLLRHAAAAADALDAWAAPCLVHGDCNPTNLVLQERHGAWQVAALLDWEYALSGIAPLDLGMLLRPPLGDSAAFRDGLAAGYRAAGGLLPPDWPRLARLADLFAWADLLSRPHIDAARLRDARAAIAETVRSLSG